MSELKDPNSISMPDAAAVERAIKITYAQVMLGSVFGASTGGMFLTGFAMQLGADDVLLFEVRGISNIDQPEFFTTVDLGLQLFFGDCPNHSGTSSNARASKRLSMTVCHDGDTQATNPAYSIK